MLDDRPLAVTTEDGKHLLAMPDGTIIPGINITRFKQDTEKAKYGYCEAFVVFGFCKVVTGKELKEIQSLNNK